jgi:hypothetical protein
MLLDIGVSFWQFDADTVAVRDFEGVLLPNVDLLISIDGIRIFLILIETEQLETVLVHKPLPNVCTGMMHFRNSPGTRVLINMIQDTLNDITWMGVY